MTEQEREFSGGTHFRAIGGLKVPRNCSTNGIQFSGIAFTLGHLRQEKYHLLIISINSSSLTISRVYKHKSEK